MRLQLALYKGPPRGDWEHTVSHYGIRVWTWSRWSHAELVIDGVCFSSSARDGGVRGKVIDLSSGRWDVFDLEVSAGQALRALAWFRANDGKAYDWPGIARFVLPLVKHSQGRYFCFEAVGAAIGIPNAHRLTADSLLKHLAPKIVKRKAQ